MTEEQAREAARLIRNLDAALKLKEKILVQYRNAQKTQYKRRKKSDVDALNLLVNIALELQEEVVRHIRREIEAIKQ